jgi:hypothetical protein
MNGNTAGREVSSGLMRENLDQVRSRHILGSSIQVYNSLQNPAVIILSLSIQQRPPLTISLNSCLDKTQ